MDQTHNKNNFASKEAGTGTPFDLSANPQKNINKSVLFEVFQPFFDHRAHSPLRLLAPPHQLLAGKQLGDPRNAHLLD